MEKLSQQMKRAVEKGRIIKPWCVCLFVYSKMDAHAMDGWID